MKSIFKFIYPLILIAFINGNVVAQTSDYQVKERFEQFYEELRSSIDNALKAHEIDSLNKEISNLKYRFEDRKELLDHALYPNTFSGSIDDLKQNARTIQHKLLVIENQSDKLTSLSDQLSNYKSEIARLNSRTNSLRDMIASSEQSERELSEIVQRYRQSMEQRDEFVLNMIDSLFITYRDMQGTTFAELEEEVENRSIRSTENPLKVIQSVIDENIQILKAGDSSLRTEDYLRMYVVHSRFNEVWGQIGDELVTLYGDNNPAQWETVIEDKLGDWKASASKNMWESIDQQLEQNNVDLGAFDNNESFYSAIESFIAKATDSSRDKVVTDENYKDFQNFYDFWNTKIKSDWGKFVQEGEVLTMSQISTIDTEMMNWRDEAKPKSFLIPILFGLSLMTIVGLIIVLARRD